MIRKMLGNVVSHWLWSRLLKQWSRVRIRHLSHWKIMRTGRVTVYTVKSRDREGNLRLRQKTKKHPVGGSLFRLKAATYMMNIFSFSWHCSLKDHPCYTASLKILFYYQQKICKNQKTRDLEPQNQRWYFVVGLFVVVVITYIYLWRVYENNIFQSCLGGHSCNPGKMFLTLCLLGFTALVEKVGHLLWELFTIFPSILNWHNWIKLRRNMLHIFCSVLYVE